ncbi:hypothetical protein RAH42_06815 [Pyramidobacter sp. YE332]|uniref:hypothetical protein n=1 Tax=Pyramidobacter sp. YE332 TaxID=3068894 RepID=UPI00294AA178|nr:hypothetical protein [Pyramidobacter sp. YE332]WOL38878.1 hypothetical protein RAH42_06815 [Pyramidobacter sp. YE332]
MAVDRRKVVFYMNNYSVKKLKAQLQNNVEFRKAVSARVSRVLVLPSRSAPVFKDVAGLDAAADPMPFLRSAVKAARAQLRRFTPVRVRVRREAVRAHVEQGADSGGDDGGGSDDGDGDGQSDSHHVGTGHEARVNVVVDSQQNKSIEEPGIAARSDALAVAGFFVPFSRQEVAA